MRSANAIAPVIAIEAQDEVKAKNAGRNCTPGGRLTITANLAIPG
jgi:hypothetical protein